jgi:hypothetical protein
MMIKITDSSSPDVKANVVFEETQSSGRKTSNYIEAKPYRALAGFAENASINVPSTGDMRLEDVPEFIKAVKLAVMIASGELEIE